MQPKTAVKALAVSVPDAAKMLGIGRNTGYEAVKRGDIRAVKIGGRIVVPLSEIKRLTGPAEAATGQEAA